MTWGGGGGGGGCAEDVNEDIATRRLIRDPCDMPSVCLRYRG